MTLHDSYKGLGGVDFLVGLGGGQRYEMVMGIDDSFILNDIGLRNIIK